MPSHEKTLERRQDWLRDYRPELRLDERGRVSSVGDGIAWVEGLPSAGMDEVLRFSDGSRGMVFHLTRKLVGVVMLEQTAGLSAGTAVYLTGRQLSIRTGEQMLGRVVDPLGNPLDDRPLQSEGPERTLESTSPRLADRDFVHEPLYTGNKIVDTMIPIGKGQRQLIVGDEGLGRSSLALDTIIHQRGRDVWCVVVLIGQKRSAVADTLKILRDYHALEYTTVVVGEASAMPGLQYLAPFAGCALAEGWMAQGRHTLVVYDDLSTHARSYRELSLLLRRPPGREAYPGDIFYLHARLLERATCLAAEFGGGSLTALPIVETLQGELASYIPTNLISITDGQVYLDRDLFAAGFRPAIDIGRSVSRIGGKAQHPRLKEEAGRMKLDYLQYLELEMFSRFGARLEAGMEQRIRRGKVLRSLLVQERLQPQPAEFQVAWLVAFNEGLFDGLEPTEIAPKMERLTACDLTLEAPRSAWVAKVMEILK